MKSYLFTAVALVSGKSSQYYSQYQQDPTAYQPSGYGQAYPNDYHGTHYQPSGYEQAYPNNYHENSYQPSGYGQTYPNEYHGHQYHPQPTAYKPTPPPAEYAPATPATEYKPEYNSYQPPKPKYADPKEEWDQFWANTELCKAEFGFRQCMLDCSSRSEFFYDKRISNCVVKFVRGFCGAIGTRAVEKCVNGRVSITTDNCQTSAYADAILQLDKLAQKIDLVSFTPLGSNPWSISAIALSIEAISQTSDCVTEAFFYYLSQCAKKSFINPKDVHCVEGHLGDSRCLQHATWGPETIELQTLLSNLEDDEPSDELIHWVKKYYGEKNVAKAIRELLEAHATGFSSRLQPMDVKFSEKKLKASIDVCPYDYIPMNFGYPDFEGIPAHLVAFHFPRDKTFREVPENNIMAAQDLLENRVTTPAPAPTPEPPVWDPKTPKYGIAKTCQKFYTFSKVLYQLADVDIKDMCYTIDGYSIKFLESGNSETLDYDWIDQDGLPEYSLSQDTLLKEGYKPYDYTEAPEYEWYNVALSHATCYKASWRAQKTCTSHLSEWQMSVQCCKSYASTLKKEHAYEYTPYEPKEYAPHPYEEQPYAPHPYGPQPYAQHGYYGATLLEDNAYPTVETTYPEKKPAYQPYPSTYTPVDPKDLVYTKIVSSNVHNGTLGTYDGSLHLINNADIVTKFGEWVDIVNGAVMAAETKISEAENDSDKLKDLLYSLHHKKWQHKEGILPNLQPPSVYHYIGGDHFAQATCEQLNIALDFDVIVPLETGVCYPQSCLLAQYSTCIENPADAYKEYKPVYGKYGYPEPTYGAYGEPAPQHYGKYEPEPQHYGKYEPHHYGGYEQQPSHYGHYEPQYGYRALLSSETGSFAALSAAGFAAGVVVVALAQLILKQKERKVNINATALI